MGSGSPRRSDAYSSPTSDRDDGILSRLDSLSPSSTRLAAVLPQLQPIVSSLISSSTSSAQPTHTVSRVVGCAGGSMLFRFALVLLVTWLVGVLFIPTAGDAVHVLLLVGPGLLLLAFLRAREEAVRRALDSHPDRR